MNAVRQIEKFCICLFFENEKLAKRKKPSFDEGSRPGLT